MLFAVKDFEDVQLYIFINGSRPFNEAFCRPFRKELMGGSQMFFVCCIGVRTFGSPVQGDAFIVIKHFNSRAGVQQLYLLADKAIRHTIVMLVNAKTYMTVFHYCCMQLLFKLVAKHRQR